MADTEFEEFRKSIDSFPLHLKAPSPFYSLVPDISEEDYPSSKSDSSDQEDDGIQQLVINSKNLSLNIKQQTVNSTGIHINTADSDKDDELGDGLRTTNSNSASNSGTGGSSGGVSSTATSTTTAAAAVGIGASSNTSVLIPTASIGTPPVISLHSWVDRTTSLSSFLPGQMERKRRKLPEIPKNKRSSLLTQYGQTSLADELQQQQQQNQQQQQQQHQRTHQNSNTSSSSNINSISQRSILALKCSYLLDEDSSPDSDRLHSLGDVDSGHSTAHSPTDLKSMSPPQTHSPTSPFPPPFGGIPFSQIEMLEATHRGLHKFIPRHHDEIEVEIGDPVYVQKEADDLWCEGVNLRTGRQGIFPSAYAVDLDYNDFDPSAQKVKKERYLLGYLGSVETMAHKGTGVVCQAVRKIVGEYGESPNGQLCILEISDQGLRMVDRSKSQGKEKKKPCIDYFYSLKNVSFCAFHPRDHRYIGFITKHPTIQRFACHVFKGHESTRPVAEAVGRAFQHFYQKFIETAYPIEDIYIE